MPIDNKKAQKLLEKGDKAFVKGKFSEMLDFYTQAESMGSSGAASRLG